MSKAKSGQMQKANNQGNRTDKGFFKVFFIILIHLIEAASKNDLNTILDV